jgi:hypothetical protein
MAVSIKNLEAERLLGELAKATGEGLTEAATIAFRERLERVNAARAQARQRDVAAMMAIAEEARNAPRPTGPGEKELMDELWGET